MAERPKPELREPTDAAGLPATFSICQEIVHAGGHIASIGVSGASVTLHVEKLWLHSIAITTRLVDKVTTQLLMNTVLAGKLEPTRVIMHQFGLDDILPAFEAFGNDLRERALKVMLTNESRGMRRRMGSRRFAGMG